MKKIILSISILTVFFLQTKAQLIPNLFPDYRFNYGNIMNLKDKTIQVVLNDDDDTSHYNETIKSALEKYWTYTKYEFISFKDYNENIENSSRIFLIPIRSLNLEGCTIDKLSIQQFSDKKFVYKGIRKRYYQFNATYFYYRPMLNLRAPYISKEMYAEIEDPDFEYFYLAKNKDIINMLPNIIREWQWENETIAAHPELSGKKEEEVQTFLTEQQNLKQLKEKTLLIDENSVNDITSEKIAEIYKYKFKLVPTKEIYKAIAEQDENICYLYNGGRADGCSYPMTIFQASGGKILYLPVDYHSVTMYGGSGAGEGVFKEYFKKLMEEIDK